LKKDVAIMRYQDPDSTMTLQEALCELRAAEADMSLEVSEFLAEKLEAHDVVHIIFGLDITDLDEVVAHVWMLFGTTLTISGMKDVIGNAEHRAIGASFARGKRGLLAVLALPRLAKALLRSFCMKKRWPWNGYDAYLDVSLADIRKEYGIRLDHPHDGKPRPRGPHHRPVALRT
jgi:hypothetical protein